MAGFQQAANALTGAVGTVANRIGLYQELVGKNQQYRAQLEEQNTALNEANEALAKKASELAEANVTINEQAAKLTGWKEHKLEQARAYSKKSRAKKKVEAGRLDRALSNQSSYMSKAMALTALYGDFASGGGGI